jgi:hypothetical protein
MPAGSVAPSMPMEPMAPVTIHVTKRRLLQLSPMSLLVLSTFMPRNLREKHANLQSKYARDLATFKIFKRHKDIYGMYQIPPLSFLHSSNLSDWLLSSKEIDGSAFIEELGKLILCQCCARQQNSINYASIQDLTNWSVQSPLLISSDGLIVTRIDKQFENMSLYEQGGATYQDCTWWNAHHWLSCCYYPPGIPLATEGIVKILNEDVCVATEQIIAVDDWPIYLPSLVNTIQILEGLTKCSVTVFRQTF